MANVMSPSQKTTLGGISATARTSSTSSAENGTMATAAASRTGAYARRVGPVARRTFRTRSTAVVARIATATSSETKSSASNSAGFRLTSSRLRGQPGHSPSARGSQKSCQAGETTSQAP